MKKVVSCALLGCVIVMAAFCKSTRIKAESAPAPMFPTSEQLAVAEQKYPGTTAEEIRQGNTIYVSRCGNCHELFEITRFSEKKWLHEIDEMAPKAELTAAQKTLLTKHILSYRQAFTKAGS